MNGFIPSVNQNENNPKAKTIFLEKINQEVQDGQIKQDEIL
jgi:hypothetical protein